MMKPLRAPGVALCLLAFGWTSQVLAGGGPGVEIPLYPDSQGAADAEIHEAMWGEPRVRNVTRPTLTVFLPEVQKPPGPPRLSPPAAAS